jgi:hypothetical protein
LVVVWQFCAAAGSMFEKHARNSNPFSIQYFMMKTSLYTECILIAATLVCSEANGETISWYSPIPVANLTSTNQLMADAIQFELGVFANGFTPTSANIAEWAKNWVRAQSTSYNSTTRVFDGIFEVTSNVAPFTKGAKAYIWHRATSSTQDEWILFRKADWIWPGTDKLSPFPLVWNTADADQVIIGDVDPAGNPFLMRSESVLSYAQWQNAELATSSHNGPADDADQDGVSNLLEFVFGSPPTQASAPPFTPTSLVGINGQNYLQISVPRQQNRLAKTLVEVSSDLVNWNSGDSALIEVADTPEMLIVRDKTPFGSNQGERFMRLKAVTDP